jgi:hypothetical protein
MVRSYSTALLHGVAEYLTGLDLDGEPLASWTLASWTEGAAAPALRPVVVAFSDRISDEAWQLTASSSTPTDARGGVVTDLHLLYRGPRDGRAMEAFDRASVVADSFRPNGRPLAHHRFGAVAIGAVLQQTLTPLGPDGNRRQMVSQTHRFRGKRHAVNPPL